MESANSSNNRGGFTGQIRAILESIAGLGQKIPFGIKLAALVTFILLGSIWIISGLMAAMVSAEFVRTAANTNFEINSRAASGVRERLFKIRSEALMLLDTRAITANDSNMSRQMRNIFFERNPYIAAIMVRGIPEIINRPYIVNNEIRQETLSAWLSGNDAMLEKAKSGSPVLLNVSPRLGVNLLALLFPWQGNGSMETAAIFFYPQAIMEIIGSGSASTILVNGDGDILVSPDFSQVLKGASIKNSELFESLMKATDRSVRLNYSEGGNRFVGAGHLISFADAAVFSSMEFSLINEQINAVNRRNMLLSITIMFLTILATWFFAKTVTTPVKKLIKTAAVISTGDFSPEFDKKPKSNSRDEIMLLTESFLNMSRGLKQWIEARDLVNRLDKPEISEKALNGQLNLAGEYFDGVVLSVDFLSLPGLNKTMESKEALELFNAVIALVAENAEKTGALIDKIAGSAITAIWGMPGSTESTTENVMNCLRSALSLRRTLSELNTERATRGKDMLKIACGIDSGKLLAGRIGRSNISEYAFTGESFGKAVESSRACVSGRTDIIITKIVQETAGSRIISEKMPSEGDELYALINVTPSQPHEVQHWPYTLNDVRASLSFKIFGQKAVAENENTEDKSE